MQKEQEKMKKKKQKQSYTERVCREVFDQEMINVKNELASQWIKARSTFFDEISSYSKRHLEEVYIYNI